MIFGCVDSLDGFLHGVDSPVVEFTTGILTPLDLGVEANNQLPQCWDLRFGGGSVAGDELHDLARPGFTAMPTLGLRKTDGRGDPFLKIILRKRFEAGHPDNVVEHGVRRAWALDGSEDHRREGDHIALAELVLEEVLKRGAGPRPSHQSSQISQDFLQKARAPSGAFSLATQAAFRSVSFE